MKRRRDKLLFLRYLRLVTTYYTYPEQTPNRPFIPHKVGKSQQDALEARDAEVTPLSRTRGDLYRGLQLQKRTQSTGAHHVSHTHETPNNTPKPDSAAAAKRAGAPRSGTASRRSRPPTALEQALDDLGLPEDLVTEIEGRLRSQQQALGQDSGDDVSRRCLGAAPTSNYAVCGAGTRTCPPAYSAHCPSAPGSNDSDA